MKTTFAISENPRFGSVEIKFSAKPDDTRFGWSLAESIVEAHLEGYEEDYRENHMDAGF